MRARKIRKDAEKMRRFDAGVTKSLEEIRNKENFYSQRFLIFDRCLEVALNEILTEKKFEIEISLNILARKVGKVAAQIHKEAFPDYKVPNFSNIEVALEKMIIEFLDLRKLLGSYDNRKRTFTPLTIEQLIEKEKFNFNDNRVK